MKTFYDRVWKRFADILLSAALLLALSPALGILALLVAGKLGRPVLFTQQRPGRNGKIFPLRKFRSMRDAVDEDGAPLPDEARLTSFGVKLRATSLDELPELWNILRGDMSFIGPRPLLVQYLSRYSSEQARRHLVRPGLTGWAQVNGRNALSWPEKFRLDVWYVDHLSPLLDVKIFLKTIRLVLKREGISGEDSATMAEFMGNEEAGGDDRE